MTQPSSFIQSPSKQIMMFTAEFDILSFSHIQDICGKLVCTYTQCLIYDDLKSPDEL